MQGFKDLNEFDFKDRVRDGSFGKPSLQIGGWQLIFIMLEIFLTLFRKNFVQTFLVVGLC